MGMQRRPVASGHEWKKKRDKERSRIRLVFCGNMIELSRAD
jgi:hypothetical protein